MAARTYFDKSHIAIDSSIKRPRIHKGKKKFLPTFKTVAMLENQISFGYVLLNAI